MLTFNLSAALAVNTHDKTLTLGGISPAFGTLLTGLLGSFLPDDSPLWNMPVGLGESTYGLKVNVQGQINTRDNSKTNILVELIDDNGGIRGTIVYSGQQEALFIDLSGLMGTGYFMIPDINLNKLIEDLMDMLVDEVKKALAENPDNAEAQAIADEINQKIGDGEIAYALSSATSDKPITDIIGLISAILDNCTLVKNGNIFNIQSLNLSLTDRIFDYLWTMIFTDENGGYTGERVPIRTLDVSFVDIGFAEAKELTINASIGQNEEVVGLGVGVTLQFGSINDKETFLKKVTISDEERALYTVIDLSKGLTLDTILGALNSVYVGLSVDVDIYAIAGNITSAEFASTNEVLIQALVDFAETIDTGAVLTLEANINLSKLLKDGAFDIMGLLESAIHISLAEKGSAESAIDLWLNEGMLYIHTADSIVDGIDISIPAKALIEQLGILGGGESEAMSADGESTETGDDSMNQIIALVAGLIGGVDISGSAVNVYLASGLIQTLVGLVGIETNEESYLALNEEELAQLEASTFAENVFVKDEIGAFVPMTGAYDASETYYKLVGTRLEIGLTDATVDGGVRVSFIDGLNLTEMGIDVYLNFDNKLDLDISIGDLKAGVNSVPSSAKLDIPEDIDFVNIFETPNIFLGIEMGINAQLNAGNTPLGNGGNVTFDEEINLGYDMRVQASLDLDPILDWLLGADAIYTNGNQTQILIEVIENKNSVETFMLGLYYVDGKLYLDASHFGIEKIAVEVDLMGIILNLVLGNDADVKVNPVNDEALASADETAIDKTKFDYALLAALRIGNEKVRIEILEGIVEALWKVAGINIAIVEAALEISWADKAGTEDNFVELSLVGKDQNQSPTGSARISIGKPDLSIDHEIVNVIPYGKTVDNAHEDFVFDGRENGYALIKLIDFDDEGNIAVALEQVFVELNLTVYLDVDNNVDSWPVGNWASLFLPEDTSDNIKGFLEQILLVFDVDYTVSTAIGVRIAAMLRFNPENMLDVNYILSHSDIAIELFDGVYEDVKDMPEKRILGITLLCDDANAPTVASTSTLYVDANVGPLKDVHLSIGDLSLAALISGVTGGEAEAQTAEETATETNTSSVVDSIVGIIGSALYGLHVNSESITLYLASTLIATVVELVAPDSFANLGDNFFALNPEKSFIKLDMNTYQIDFSAGIDPFTVGMSLTNFAVGFSDKYTVASDAVKEDIADNNYISATNLSTLAFEAAVELKVEICDTQDFENNELPINDIVSAFIADFALAIGVEIEKDMLLDVELLIAGNLSLDNPEETELMVEIKNLVVGSNATEDGIVLGIYLRGRNLYVDMGILSENDFVVENTGISAWLIETITSLLGSVEEGGEAMAASDEDAVTTAEQALEAILAIASDKLSLSIAQQTLVGVLAFVVELAMSSEESGSFLGDINIGEAIKKLPDLGIELNFEVDFDTTSLTFDFASDLFNTSIYVRNPQIAAEKLGSVSARIDDGIYHYQNELNYKVVEVANYGTVNSEVDLIYVKEDGQFVRFTNTLVNDGTTYYQYVGGDNGVGRFNNFANNQNISFNVELEMQFNLDETYILVDEATAKLYGDDERYSRRESDGQYAQDPNGLYVKNPLVYSDLLESLFSLEAVQNLISGLEEGAVKNLVGALLDRLGLEMYLNDPINETIVLRVWGNVDLAKLGVSDLLTKLELENFNSALAFSLCLATITALSSMHNEISLRLSDNVSLLEEPPPLLQPTAAKSVMQAIINRIIFNGLLILFIYYHLLNLFCTYIILYFAIL